MVSVRLRQWSALDVKPGGFLRHLRHRVRHAPWDKFLQLPRQAAPSVSLASISTPMARVHAKIAQLGRLQQPQAPTFAAIAQREK